MTLRIDFAELPLSKLEFQWVDTKEGYPSSRFLDFVVDGDSLYELLGSQYPSTLGRGPYDNQVVVVNELLLRQNPEHEFVEERQQLYVCPMCGDIYCGAITATIIQVQNRIVWKDFAIYQPRYEEDPDGTFRPHPSIIRDDIDIVGPFVFDAKSYTKALEAALLDIKETLGEVIW